MALHCAGLWLVAACIQGGTDGSAIAQGTGQHDIYINTTQTQALRLHSNTNTNTNTKYTTTKSTPLQLDLKGELRLTR